MKAAPFSVMAFNPNSAAFLNCKLPSVRTSSCLLVVFAVLPVASAKTSSPCRLPAVIFANSLITSSPNASLSNSFILSPTRVFSRSPGMRASIKASTSPGL